MLYMAKLTKIQKQELKDLLTSGQISAEDASEKYGLTSRQIRYYKKAWDVPKQRKGRKKEERDMIKKPTEKLKGEDTDEVTEGKQKEKDPDIEIAEGFGAQVAQDEDKDEEEHKDIDYCASCYVQQGKKVVLNKGQKYCPVCGVELEWQ